jgi:hypothetical protein
MLEICQIKFICQKYLYWEYYKHTAFSWGCYGRLPQEEKSPEGDIFYECGNLPNSLNQRQYVLYYTECLSEGGIAGYGISLQYHPLLWWAGLRKVREKYHIYIYQWNRRIIKEICIKYNIIFSFQHPFDLGVGVCVLEAFNLFVLLYL